MEIQLIGVNKYFGSKKIFSNFNLDIPKDSITIIMGESGSGKTTLLNMIGTIESYDGQILYDGNLLEKGSHIRDFRKNKVSFIFQNYGLIDNETVYDNFSVIQSHSKKNKEKVDRSLSKVGLPNFGSRKVYELSGGEQQRVAIAKAIFKDADLILADEPTASIDEINKKVVLDLLNQLNKMGKTVIIVTHDNQLKSFFDNPNIVYL